ncbi:DUF2809 domain-containing protein [Streptomyces sp. NPDC001380]|uniref:ribosomal maturation YjgA family protein n=1 Tax=Streptomyces sp. NPDC001380 TaxID=3364566 RepID=UPI0036BDE310
MRWAAAAAAAAAVLAAGLVLRAAGGAAAAYSGAALYTALVYALAVLAAPRTAPRAAAAAALGWSWAVECLQLTGLPARLSQHSTAVRLVLGSTFDARDLALYAVGALCCGLLHTAARAARPAAR